MKFIISFSAKRECLSEFEKVMEQTKQQLPTAEGCQGVEIYRNTSQGDHFTLVETWDSIEAHKSHVEYLVQTGVWKQLLNLLSNEPEGAYFSAY